MTMTKSFLFVLWGLVFGLTGLGAQQVAEDVLRGREIQGIEFKNYEGPHRIIESRLAIQGIGADLGRQMKVPGALEADYGKKYQVLRLHDPASDKLSADLFILSPDAGVDHIRNLNWIVSSYLQQAFGYPADDADLLASFVTRYNAFYRGKVDHVAAQYIPSVSAAVTAENLGLALVWSEWPGKTRMVIPLRDSLSKGLGGSVNTEEISNKDVVTQMAATEPDQGLADRKKLADLKEGEIVQEQKAVAKAEAPPAQAAPAGTPAGTVPTNTAPGNTAPEGTTPATTTPGATATTPAAAATPTPAATLPLAEAKKDLAARDHALQAERQDIVKQESKTPEVTPPPAAAVTAPSSTSAFVKMNEAAKTGQVWLVDPATNRVWKKSQLNTVRQSVLRPFGAGLLTVAGDTKGANGAIRLVLVSKDDASVLVTGADDVSADTPLVLSGNQLLALTKGDKGVWVLGLFDTGLKALAKGVDALSPLTAVVPTTGGILVQAAGGGVILLDEKTLKKKSDTEG